MTHLVHRQIFELSFLAQQDAQRWSSRLAELNQRLLLPELERVFDEVVGTGRSLRIERLELDLGRLRLDDLELELPRRLRQQLLDALQEHRTGDLRIESVGSRSGEDSVASELEQLDAASLEELLGHFFRSGQFPWWLGKRLVGQLDFLYRRFWGLAAERARPLVLQIFQEPVARRRFSTQLSPRSLQFTLQQLLPAVTAEPLDDLRRLGEALLLPFAPQTMALQLSRLALSRLLVRLVAAPIEQPTEQLRRYLDYLAEHSGIPLARLLQEVDRGVSRRTLSAATRRLLSELLRERPFASETQLLREHPHPDVPLEPAPDAVEPPPAAPGTGLEVVIDNAGLVLLWPHLKEILRKLELLEELPDGGQRPRPAAVLLLQQLATGSPAAPEHQLVLNKLLCGLPLNAPVPRRLRRSPNWTNEVEALLGAVIAQWSVLKTTSVAGLRSTFLQREGLLQEAESGWVLLVERKACDILLEQLPWGVGMIQLSWMHAPLRVEW